MTAEPDLLPLPEAMIESYQTDSTMRTMTLHSYSGSDMRSYARANVAHATAALQAEVERLRGALEECHALSVERWRRLLAAEAEVERLRAERDALREALEEIRSRSTINLAMHPDPFELTARLGDIHQIADAAL